MKSIGEMKKTAQILLKTHSEILVPFPTSSLSKNLKFLFFDWIFNFIFHTHTHIFIFLFITHTQDLFVLNSHVLGLLFCLVGVFTLEGLPRVPSWPRGQALLPDSLSAVGQCWTLAKGDAPRTGGVRFGLACLRLRSAKRMSLTTPCPHKKFFRSKNLFLAPLPSEDPLSFFLTQVVPTSSPSLKYFSVTCHAFDGCLMRCISSSNCSRSRCLLFPTSLVP
jgi:hypothetical protein